MDGIGVLLDDDTLTRTHTRLRRHGKVEEVQHNGFGCDNVVVARAVVRVGSVSIDRDVFESILHSLLIKSDLPTAKDKRPNAMRITEGNDAVARNEQHHCICSLAALVHLGNGHKHIVVINPVVNHNNNTVR